jgi:hypothetical protein
MLSIAWGDENGDDSATVVGRHLSHGRRQAQESKAPEMCRLLGVSPKGCHPWREPSPSALALASAVLLAKRRAVQSESRVALTDP